MNFKNLNLCLITAGLTISAVSIAQAQSKFEGFYGQVAVGYEGINPTLTNSPFSVGGTSTTVPLSTSISTTSGATGNVAMGYTASVSQNFTLALGGEYYPVNSQSGNYSGTALGRTANGTYQKQNAYNIYLAPGMNVGKDGLAYLKVGYSGASVKSTVQGASDTQNLTGYSLGLGYKQFFAGNWYGFGEANYFSYSNVTATNSSQVSGRTVTSSNTFGANVYNLLVGVGYKF
jgi:hypothetical protein